MSNPLRILHVIGRMDRGGAEALIMNLYRSVDRSVIQFDFVENTNDRCAYDDEIEQLGGRIFRCPHFNGWNYPVYKAWWIHFWKDHPEYRIVHGHLGSTAGIYMPEAKKYGVFTIAHSHNTHIRHSVKGLFFRMLTYSTRYIADDFFACSEQAGKDRFGEKTPFRILNNAIDTSRFQYDEEERRLVRREFGIEDKEYLIGHVGRMDKQKNHFFLLDAFCKLAALEPDAKLMLVGDGPLRQDLESKVKMMAMENKVIMTGLRSDVHRLLQAMDCFVMPSFFEGLPVSLVEAQTSGLPCFISDGVPEDCMITDLVQQMPLSAGTEEWADRIAAMRGHKRRDRSEAVADAGFDAASNARFLEDYYLGIIRKKEK